jgi:hypothetical protein
MTNDLTDVTNVTNMRLWLPSDIPATLRAVVATPALVRAELDLLVAELHDRLVTIRKLRRALMVLRRVYRGDETTGSVSEIRTRQREKISGMGEKIEVAKTQYQAAWIAARDLDPTGIWMETYRWLDAKDIRGPSAIDDLSDLASSKLAKKLHHKDAGDLGQGTYVKSWIWCVAVTDNTDPEDTLRGEWARCAANSARWEEERELVPIEMGRTLAAFEWEAQRWKARIGTRPSASPALQHALDTYARQQEEMIRQRIVLFASTWLPFLSRSGIAATWTQKYHHLVPVSAWTPPKRGDAIGCTYRCLMNDSCLTLSDRDQIETQRTIDVCVHIITTGLPSGRIISLDAASTNAFNPGIAIQLRVDGRTIHNIAAYIRRSERSGRLRHCRARGCLSRTAICGGGLR